MLKNVFLAAAATAVLAGASLAAPVPAQAMTCQEYAKAKAPDSLVNRVGYRRDCKKAYKAAVGRKGPLAAIRSKLSG